MLVCSIRSSTLKFSAGVLLGVLLLTTLICFIPGEDRVEAAAVSIRYDGIKSEADRVAFLRQFGWEVKDTPPEVVTLTVPAKFDRLFTSYNRIQLRQGLDLGDYRRKTVTRYTYELAGYAGYDGTVLASLIVYRDRVIAGDICSAEQGEKSFVHGFEKN